ncbi:MAG: DUF3267 domain-containing protein [Anaerolineaceae bacterium]|nr:DUF3267 domain-containing protein [Anaerolineaceae bacterium]
MIEEIHQTATQNLPETYQSIEVIDIAKQTGLVIGMNVVGLLLFFGSYWIFFQLISLIRSVDVIPIFEVAGLSQILIILLGGILFIVALVILHEAVHGLFFRLFTGSKPKFAFKLSYAYAAAPDWYIRRNAYLVIGAAPVVLITIVGLICCCFVPQSWLAALILFISLNFSSSVGDLYVLLRLFSLSQDIYIRDEGDKMTFYKMVFEDIPL